MTTPKTLRSRFLLSSPDLAQSPPLAGPEIVIAGRSNVGKSSLLNLLLGQRLARVSQTPGRTRLLNFFELEIENQPTLRLVDLPGYGYAKISEDLRRSFGPMIENYLLQRESLAAMVLLIDIRRDAREEELQLVAFAEARQLPLLLLVTKADQVSKANRFPHLQKLQQQLQLRRKPIATSAQTGEGRDEALRALLRIVSKPEEKNDV